ncbi:MAG TPA: hypothetical protein VGP06_02760, partial [Janthinobacterium sp.]|nr:hypothetical protein [Janthinobacterium sp.]
MPVDTQSAFPSSFEKTQTAAINDESSTRPILSTPAPSASPMSAATKAVRRPRTTEKDTRINNQ